MQVQVQAFFRFTPACSYSLISRRVTESEVNIPTLEWVIKKTYTGSKYLLTVKYTFSVSLKIKQINFHESKFKYDWVNECVVIVSEFPLVENLLTGKFTHIGSALTHSPFHVSGTGKQLSPTPITVLQPYLKVPILRF